MVLFLLCSTVAASKARLRPSSDARSATPESGPYSFLAVGLKGVPVFAFRTLLITAFLWFPATAFPTEMDALEAGSSDGPGESQPEEESEESGDIRERRHFQSKTSVYRVLETPQLVLDLPWYPIQLFLNYSERTDLFTRVQDIFYFNEERTFGWFPKISVGGPIENGLGLSLFHHNLFDNHQEADFAFLYAGDRDFEVKGAYTLPPAAIGPYRVTVDASLFRDDEFEVFVARDARGRPVVGNDTREDDDTEYSMRHFFSKIEAGRRFAYGMDLKAHLRGEVGEATPSGAQSRLLLQGLPGFDETIGMIGGGLDFAWDGRNDVVRPDRGWLLGAGAQMSVAPVETRKDNRFGYGGYSLDGQLFVPLFAPHRVLFFRQQVERLEPLDGRQIPFWSLPILDRNHDLRSFERNRFQDQGVILTNIEYRYPIWVTWDAFLFFDAGQTFDEYSDIDLSEYRVSGGFGVRFLSQDKVNLVFHVGFGQEGPEVVFNFGQLF